MVAAPSGSQVAAAYPGTPSTEMLEVISDLPGMSMLEWSSTRKSRWKLPLAPLMAGSRAFCCMTRRHERRLRCADDLTLTGVIGGLVIAIADDVGCRPAERAGFPLLGRFAHVPVFEPGRFPGSPDMTPGPTACRKSLQVPVILRMTTRICHVKGWSPLASVRNTLAPVSRRTRRAG